MRVSFVPIALALVAVLGVLRPTPTAAQADARITVRVITIIDGDTLRVLLPGGVQERLRLVGIDAPEIVHPSKAVQCYGPEAARRASELAMGRPALLELETQQRDQYGRLLGYLWVDGSMVMLNTQLVAEGYAVPLGSPAGQRHADEIARAADTAREHGVGIWSACDDPLGQAARDIEPTVEDVTLAPGGLPSAAAPDDQRTASGFDPTRYLGQGDRYDCPDFASQAEAQAVLRADPADPNRLDRERRGIACENNPEPYDLRPVPRP